MDNIVPQIKRCCTCGQDKPVIDFPKDKGKRDGLSGRCKECAKVQARKQRAEQPERVKETKRQWYLENKEYCSNKNRIWRKNNRDKIKIDNKSKYERNKDSIKRRASTWYWNNLERARAYRRNYNKSNPEKRYENHARRRARIKGATQLEKIDRAAIIKRDNNTCYLCGKHLRRWQITLDHVIPLVRGGKHISENLRVACHSCNSRKGTKLLCEM